MCPVIETFIVGVQLLQQLLCVPCYCNSYCVCPVTATVIVCVLLLQQFLCVSCYCKIYCVCVLLM